ncbi:hypothetical protein BU075_00075 [Mammaliicoccus vitulinus]|uniref:hypothetical protein n=1 Tax=Mammaliicoccus vitulinus TaxID=71237 RepID=UPI000E6A07CB|nr:hypothetical protein [Mammaliicoccus vitulinus]RIN17668.1 hypothetical protein BU075_00075 [Mammaliicoccus vitulinus]
MKEKWIYGGTFGLSMIFIAVVTQLFIFNTIDWTPIIGISIGSTVLLLTTDIYSYEKHNIFKKENLIFILVYLVSLILINLLIPSEFRIYPLCVVVVIILIYDISKRRKKRKKEKTLTD